jgi:serine phosphatase RsbU (regulator of sigma subunit)
LNETFENLNKYSHISAQFRTFYKKEELYKGSAELAFTEIQADAFEIFEVEDGDFKNVFFRYRNTENFQQTKEERESIANAIYLKEAVILNAPQPESIREKKIFAVFPIIEEEKVTGVLFFGYDNRKVSMIKDYILELIDGFSLNFRLTLKTAEMIKVLEDKVAERTRDLKKANSQLKEINAEIDDKNKSKIKEIEIGANIQRTVIPDPKQIPKIGPLSVGAVWIPMPMKKTGQEKVNIKEVSGDFFNYYQISENEVGFVIADASGHGIPAALLTMMASSALSFNSRKGGTTAEICSRSNQEVYNAIGDIGYYLTAFYLKINLRTLEVQYTNAGHHPALIYRGETGEIESWDSEGFFIGSFEEAMYGYGDNKLKPGDKVLMNTDGIEEARRLIPEKIKRNKFETGIFSKIESEEDKKFIQEIYYLDEEQKHYLLVKDEELNDQMKDRLVEILRSTNYAFNNSEDKQRADFYEDDRLSSFLKNNYHIHAKDFAEKLLKEVQEFSNGYPADDDITILVLDIGTFKEDSANVLMEKAVTYLNHKEFDEAEKKVLEYIDKYGEESEVLLQLAEVYFLSNQLDKSEETFKRIRKLEPKDYRPLQGLSKIAYARKDFEKSAEYSQEATKLMTLSRRKK